MRDFGWDKFRTKSPGKIVNCGRKCYRRIAGRVAIPPAIEFKLVTGWLHGLLPARGRALMS